MDIAENPKLFRQKRVEIEPARLRERPREGIHPFAVFGTEGQPTVYVTRDVLLELRERCRQSAPDETIGLLGGSLNEDREGIYTIVRDLEEANTSEKTASPGSVSISPSGTANVRERLLKRNPAHHIVGWWHTHPTFQPRYSSVDIAEQATYGRDQVGIVVSGLNKEDPFGVYQGPDALQLARLPEFDSSDTVSAVVTKTSPEEPAEVGEPTQPHPFPTLITSRRKVVHRRRSKWLLGWMALGAAGTVVAAILVVSWVSTQGRLSKIQRSLDRLEAESEGTASRLDRLNTESQNSAKTAPQDDPGPAEPGVSAPRVEEAKPAHTSDPRPRRHRGRARRSKEPDSSQRPAKQSRSNGVSEDEPTGNPGTEQ